MTAALKRKLKHKKTKSGAEAKTPVFFSKRGGQLDDAAAQRLGQKLRRLRRSRGGILTDEMIVEAAESEGPNSDLGRYLDLDKPNAYAVRQWRLMKARRLIAFIENVTDDGERIKAFHLVPVPGTDVKSYTPVEDVADEPLSADYVIDQCRRELDRVRVRFKKYTKVLTPELREIIVYLDKKL